jgi:hypothetical protein
MNCSIGTVLQSFGPNPYQSRDYHKAVRRFPLGRIGYDLAIQLIEHPAFLAD